MLLRTQLPEVNGFVEYVEKTDSMEILKPAVQSNEHHTLTSQEWVIDTETVSPSKQQDMMDDEDVEGEMDEEDEDEELRDNTFKIYRRLDKGSPGHVMRYCLSEKTKPAFYSDYDQFEVSAIPPCQHCGAKRIFEFQLGCQLLATVKELLHLDWGIVAAYTCANSCDFRQTKTPATTFFAREHLELQLAPDEIDRHNYMKARERKIKEFQEDMEEGEGEIPTEEEIRKIAAQIREEEARTQHQPKPVKAVTSNQPQSKEDDMDAPKGRPPKKLFDEGDDEDDWG